MNSILTGKTQIKETASTLSLLDSEIALSYVRPDGGVQILSGLLGGNRYDNQEDCEANGGSWDDIGQGFCTDRGTGDWD